MDIYTISLLTSNVVLAIWLFLLYSKLQKEKRLSQSDSLTGILNRRGFDEEAKKLTDYLLPAIILIDLDRLKEVNDKYGHDAGDRVLVLFAEILREIFPPDTILARQGGDEFIIYHLQQKDGPILFDTLNRLRIVFEKEAVHTISKSTNEDVECDPSISWGIAIAPENGNNLPSLIKEADKALYQMKEEKAGGRRKNR